MTAKFDILFHATHARDEARRADALERDLEACEVTRDLCAKNPGLEAALRQGVANGRERAEWHRAKAREYAALAV